MSAWINTTAIGQILAAGLILGAGLPALFSLGVRLNAEGVGVVSHDGPSPQKNPALVALSWLIFALVLAAVIVGCALHRPRLHRAQHRPVHPRCEAQEVACALTTP